MTKKIRSAFLFAVVISGLRNASAQADEPAATPKQAAEQSEHPFHTTNAWQIHIEVSAEEYAAMQPRGGGGGFFGFGRQPSAPPAKLSEDRVQELHRNQFGVDLPWAKGTITVGEQTFPNVGIRYKGNGTIMDAQGSIKKSWKIELDHFGGDGNFLGLKTINLHCGVTDPSKCRETLAYGLYREAGVPAPRTALAEVWLTVPGKYDKQLLGLYTMVENVGGSFLRAHFESDEGLLMKPENVRDIEYMGAYWPAYEPKLEPKRKATEPETERVIALARLIHKADDAAFGREIAGFIDVEEYLRFLAVTAYLANSDSFFMLGHNYYLYLHPKTGQFHFIPWDLDRAFANFFMFGSPDQQMDLSLRHPYAGKHRLTERLLEIPEVSARYDALLKELAATCFAKDRLLAELETAEQAVSDLKDRDAKATELNREGERVGPPPGMFGAIPDLRTFIDRRTESVASQVAGTTTGHVPRGGFGPGGFGPPGPGGPPGRGPRPPAGDMLARPMLTALDADKDSKLAKAEWIQAATDLFEDAEIEGDGKADEQSLAKALEGRFPSPPGGERRGPPGFNLGGMMARPIVKRADADDDGKLILEELTTAASELFDEFDPEHAEKLDQAVFGELLNKLFADEQSGPAPRGPRGVE